MGKTTRNKTLTRSYQSPLGCVVERDRRDLALRHIFRACSVPSNSPRRNQTYCFDAHGRAWDLWNMIRWSVGVELAWEAAFYPRAPSARESRVCHDAAIGHGQGLSLVRHILLHSVPGHLPDTCCPVAPRKTGSVPWAPMPPYLPYPSEQGRDL